MKKNKIILMTIILSFFAINLIGSKKLDFNEQLFVAAKDGNLNKIKELFKDRKGKKSEVDPNSQVPHNSRMGDLKSKTALMIAAQQGHMPIVQELLNLSSINVNIQDDRGNTALMLALQNGFLNIALELLKKTDINIKYSNKEGYNAVMIAAKHGQKDMVVTLLNKLAAANDNDFLRMSDKALLIASSFGRIDIVEALLQIPHINVNFTNMYNQTALFVAVKHNYKNVVHALLQVPTIQVNIRDIGDNTALMVAILTGNLYIVQELLKISDIDLDIKTALIEAIEKGYVSIVLELLKKPGINVNVQDNYGINPLMIASRKGYVQIVQELLKNVHIDVNAQSIYRDDIEAGLDTALMLAIKYNHQEIARELLHVPGIDVNKKNISGWTALLLALQRKNWDLVKSLLIAGAAVDNRTLQEMKSLPDSTEKRQIIAVFDALNSSINVSNYSETIKTSALAMVDAYRQFLQGDHQELRNLLLVVPDAVQKIDQKQPAKTVSYSTFYINQLKEAISIVFKKESIKPLLYFLANNQGLRTIANKILS